MVNFICDGMTYNCAEQYMMHKKALLFNDAETAKRVMETTNPYMHQQLGRKIKGFNQALWDANKERIVYEGNVARFNQSQECRDLLLSTGDKILVESSPVDRIWGIGLSKEDPRALDENQWRGQNLLGKILTRVRNELLEIKNETQTN